MHFATTNLQTNSSREEKSVKLIYEADLANSLTC
jgi:hypothetical protein